MKFFIKTALFLLLSFCPFYLTASFKGATVTNTLGLEASYSTSSLGQKDACCDEDRHRPLESFDNLSEEASKRIVDKTLKRPSKEKTKAPVQDSFSGQR